MFSLSFFVMLYLKSQCPSYDVWENTGRLLNFYRQWAESSSVILTTLKEKAFIWIDIISAASMLCYVVSQLPSLPLSTRYGIMLLVQNHKWSMIFSSPGDKYSILKGLLNPLTNSGQWFTKYDGSEALFTRYYSQCAMTFQVRIIVNKSVYTSEGIFL